MDILLKDLSPGQQYIIQVRAFNARDTSEFSPAKSFTTIGDTVSPKPVTSLTAGFTGMSMVATWTAPTQKVDNSTLNNLKDYKVTLVANSITKIYYTQNTRFELSFEDNKNAFTTPQGSVQVTVEARNTYGTLSTSVTATATNAAPAIPTGLSGSAVYDAIELKWNANTEDDLAGYEVYFNSTNTGAGTLVYSGKNNAYTHTSVSQTPHYFCVLAYDIFGVKSAVTAYIGPFTPKTASQVDTAAPAAVTGITVASASDVNGPAATVTWNRNAETDVDNYTIRYSTSSTGPWEYMDVPHATSGTTQTATVRGLIPNANYYFALGVQDFSANKAAFTNATPYPVTITGNTAAPGVPTGVASFEGFNSITVYWNENTEADVKWGAGTYDVQIATDSGFTANVRNITTAAPAATISGLLSNATYYIKVRARNSSGTASAYSSAIVNTIGNPGDDIPTGTLPMDRIKANDVITSSLTLLNDTPNGRFGQIASSDYVAGSTGFRLRYDGLEVNNGTIRASALAIQDSQNIIHPAYADFEFRTDYYTGKLAGTATGVGITTTNAKFNTSALQWTANGTLYLGSSTTDYNILLDQPATYIISYYAAVSVGSATVTPSITTNIPTTFNGSAQVLTSTVTRYSFTVTIPASATASGILWFTGSGNGTVQIDGIQVERQIGNVTTPSQWKPPGSTRVDGGIIRTGEIRSNILSSVGDTTQPAWSINTQGNAQLNDVLVRGKVVVGAAGNTFNSSIAIASYNYGGSGSQWSIFGDGTFNIKTGTGSGVTLSGGGLTGNDGTGTVYLSGRPAGETFYLSNTGTLMLSGTLTGSNIYGSVYASSSDPTVNAIRIGPNESIDQGITGLPAITFGAANSTLRPYIQYDTTSMDLVFGNKSATYYSKFNISRNGGFYFSGQDLESQGAEKQYLNISARGIQYRANMESGTQSTTHYFRTNHSFGWYLLGGYSPNYMDPGTNGTLLMKLDNGGNLTVPGTITYAGGTAGGSGGTLRPDGEYVHTTNDTQNIAGIKQFTGTLRVTGAAIDLSNISGTTVAGSGTVGDKVALYNSGSGGYGIGIQASAFVNYIPTTASWVVRPASATGNASSSATTLFSVSGTGNVSASGTISGSGGQLIDTVTVTSAASTTPLAGLKTNGTYTLTYGTTPAFTSLTTSSTITSSGLISTTGSNSIRAGGNSRVNLEPNSASANGFTFALGFNTYWTGTTYQSESDGANNSGALIRKGIGTGALMFNVFDSAGNVTSDRTANPTAQMTLTSAGALNTTGNITENGSRVFTVNSGSYASAPPAVAAAGSAGTASNGWSRGDHTHSGVTSLAVTNNASVNASSGVVTITNSLTPSFTSLTTSGNANVNGGVITGQVDANSYVRAGVNGTAATPATNTSYQFQMGPSASLSGTIGFDATNVYIQSWAGKPLRINGQGNAIFLDQNTTVTGALSVSAAITGTTSIFAGTTVTAAGNLVSTGGDVVIGTARALNIGANSFYARDEIRQFFGDSATNRFRSTSDGTNWYLQTDKPVVFAAYGSSTSRLTIDVNGSITAANSGSFGGSLTATGLVRSGTGTAGYTILQPGNATNSGYIEFYSTSASARQGYIGFTSTTGAIDTGTISYTAGAHSFTGHINGSGDVVARTGTSSAVALVAGDQTVGAWIRNNGTDTVFSTRNGNMYYGFSGSANLTHNWTVGRGTAGATAADMSLAPAGLTLSNGSVASSGFFSVGATGLVDNWSAATVIAAGATGTLPHYGIGGFTWNDGNGSVLTNTGVSGYGGISLVTNGVQRYRVQRNGNIIATVPDYTWKRAADGSTIFTFDLNTLNPAGVYGVMSAPAQSISGNYLVNESVTSAKLSYAAVATRTVTTGSQGDSRRTLLRYVTGPTYADNGTAKFGDGGFVSKMQTGTTFVSDSYAFGDYAFKSTAGSTADGTYVTFGPYYGSYTEDPGLLNGNYAATVYVRVVPGAGANANATAFETDVTGAGWTPTTYSWTPAQLGSLGYVGITMPFNPTADSKGTAGIEIRVRHKTAAAYDVYVSHVTIAPVATALSGAYVSGSFERRVAIVDADIQNASVTKLIAGTIQTDDINLGNAGRIYAGNSKGAASRVELTGGGSDATRGLFGYSAGTNTFKLTADGNFQLRGKPSKNLMVASNHIIINNWGVLAGTVTKGAPDANGWVSLTGGGSLRGYVNLADLVNGATYNFSMDIRNNTGSSKTITVDWCDNPLTVSGPQVGYTVAGNVYTIPNGATVRISGQASRANYDSTYRFVDLESIGTGLEVRYPQVEAGYDPTDFVGVNAYLDLKPESLTFYNNNAATVSLDAVTGAASFAGTITANSGYIGTAASGWTINSDNMISRGTNGAYLLLHASGYMGAFSSTTNARVYMDGRGTTGGGSLIEAFNSANNKVFGISNAGTGYLSGWNFDQTQLYAAGLYLNNSGYIIAYPTNGVGGGTYAIMDGRNAGGVQFGIVKNNNYQFKAEGGDLYLTGSMSVSGHIEVGNDPSGTGGNAGGYGDSYVIVRRPSNQPGTTGAWVMLDGRNTNNNAISSSTGRFTVSYDGDITASNVNLTGTINATAGNFSGNITSSATITGGTLQTTDSTVQFNPTGFQLISKPTTNLVTNPSRPVVSFSNILYAFRDYNYAYSADALANSIGVARAAGGGDQYAFVDIGQSVTGTWYASCWAYAQVDCTVGGPALQGADGYFGAASFSLPSRRWIRITWSGTGTVDHFVLRPMDTDTSNIVWYSGFQVEYNGHTAYADSYEAGTNSSRVRSANVVAQQFSSTQGNFQTGVTVGTKFTAEQMWSGQYFGSFFSTLDFSGATIGMQGGTNPAIYSRPSNNTNGGWSITYTRDFVGDTGVKFNGPTFSGNQATSSLELQNTSGANNSNAYLRGNYIYIQNPVGGDASVSIKGGITTTGSISGISGTEQRMWKPDNSDYFRIGASSDNWATITGLAGAGFRIVNNAYTTELFKVFNGGGASLNGTFSTFNGGNLYSANNITAYGRMRVGGNNGSASDPTPLYAGTYFQGSQTYNIAEFVDPVASPRYSLITIRQQSVGSASGESGVGILFKLSSEGDANESNKSGAFWLATPVTSFNNGPHYFRWMLAGADIATLNANGLRIGNSNGVNQADEKLHLRGSSGSVVARIQNDSASGYSSLIYRSNGGTDQAAIHYFNGSYGSNNQYFANQTTIDSGQGLNINSTSGTMVRFFSGSSQKAYLNTTEFYTDPSINVKVGNSLLKYDGSPVVMGAYSYWSVYTNATQSIPNSTWTNMTQWVNGTGVNYSISGGQAITISYTGIYVISAGVNFSANNTGTRYIRFVKNGTADANALPGRASSPGGDNAVTMTTTALLNAGDVLRVQVYQNATGGGALSTAAQSTAAPDANSYWSAAMVARTG